ncbi:MAG: T9SS C-terminal target domain-containing protein [Bacteroidetes bacterium]|nr:MAG: T9SS C-terminal target domain-containing protein [Bacteroidota bacterium]
MKKKLLSSFIFLSISLFAQFTLPAPRDTSNFGKYLQRTMKLLATSTPTKKNTVKIMVYGQSIAKQEWSDSVRKYLKIRYPNANIIMINRAIGGCWAGCLQNPMAYDIKTFYPDLILFDVYGWNAWGGDQGPEYENILNYIRTNTAAEIAMQNHHVGTGDKNSGNVNSGGPRYFSELATKYGIELIDMRTPWFKYLQDNSLLETDLAPDGTHLNNRGWFLMSKLYMPYLHYRPNKWITADTFGLMKSYVVGKDIFAINGKITLPFNGNKIDIVHESPVANMDSASVLIDSKRPSSIAGSVMFTRPNDTYDTLFRHNSYDWPWQKGAIMKFNPNTSPLLRAQDWTLRFLTYNAGSNFTYSVTGTRTGGDGTASVNITSGLATSGSTFTSNSGQFVIDPAQFWFGNGPYSALPLAAGFTITWQAKAFYTDTFIPSTAPGTAIEVVSTLAQGISNANHILELDAKGAKNTPIKEIRVYQPFYSRVATSSTLIPPVLSVTSPITICSGLTANLTTAFVDTKNLVGTVTYWQNAAATISVTAPNLVSLAGTYYIRKQVTTSGVGFMDIKPIDVIIKNSPVLTLTGNTNSCDNSIASLTVSGAIAYLWRPTNSTQPILTTSITGVYTVIGTNPNQCSASMITTITSVNCPPYPTLSVTGPISICSGLTADLTTSFVDTKNLVGTVTYWQNAGATISVTAPNMVSVAGTYYIRKQVTTNTGVGFVDIKPIQVLVFATPVLTVAGNTNSCDNSIASLTVSGASTYLWRPTNSTQPILTTSITGVYTVIGTNPNQCSASMITTITSVNCPPYPTLSVTGPISICSGLTADLTTSFVDTKNLVGTVTYWQNAGATISVTAPNLVSVAGTYYIRKQVTTNTGVGFVDIKPIQVLVFATPVLTVAGNTNSCDNNLASLTISGASSYLWRPTNSTQPILTTSITGVYTVIGTNQNQCSTTIITTIMSVNCPPYPTLSVTGPISICSGLTADLTTSFVDTKNLVGTVTYWQNAGATISVTAPNLVSVAGTYYIRKQVTTNTGVGFVDIKPIQVLVFATPVLTIAGNTNSCENNIASLTVSGANTYLWRHTNSTQPILTTSITGVYTVIGTNPNQCSASMITSINCITQSIFENNEDYIIINPNPANDKITVSTKNYTILNIRLINSLGYKVLETADNQIDIFNLPNGLYIIQIESLGNKTYKKLIISH